MIWQCRDKLTEILHQMESSNFIDECNDTPTDEQSSLISQYPTTKYRRRWFMLFIFASNLFMDSVLFVALSAINNIATKHYNVSSVYIEWLTNMMTLGLILLALPTSYFISRFGVKPSLIIAAFLHAIGLIIRCFAFQKDRYWILILSQAFPSLGTSILLVLPARVSSLWFPEDERATATSIGLASIALGIAFKFPLSTSLVKTDSGEYEVENGIKSLYIVQMVIGLIILLISFFFKEKPPTPPDASPEEEVCFARGLKLLCRNKYFICLSQSYGIYVGLQFSTTALINVIVSPRFQIGYEPLLGWMGFCNIVAAILSYLCIGRLLDRYHQYRITAVLLNAFSMMIWLTFTIVLMHSKNFKVIFALYIVLGISNYPFLSTGMEQAAQMTYPVHEHTSTAVMMVFANCYTFVFTLILGYAIQEGFTEITGYSIAGLYLTATILAYFSKTDLKRLIGENKK